MNYLYHLIPDDLVGQVLYPLNTLKTTHPDLYAIKIKKYEGREHVTEQYIPTLNCLWNDVLHFTAAPPSEVRKALQEAGVKDPRPLSAYQIDPQLLNPENTTVYLYNREKRSEVLAQKHFTTYDPNNLDAFVVLPQGTRDYYRECIANRQRPLLFHKVPHILYKGSLTVSDLPTVTA